MAQLALKGVDFVGRDLLEAVGDRVTGFELRAIYQDRPPPAEGLAVHDVGEQRQVANPPDLLFLVSFRVGAMACDPLVDHLRRRSVVADDDVDRRSLGLLLAPDLVGLFVVAIEREQRGFELRRHLGGCHRTTGAPAAAREIGAHVLVDVTEDWLVALNDIVMCRDARNHDDAALDRVHKREVRDHPGKKFTLPVAGTAQEKWRG